MKRTQGNGTHRTSDRAAQRYGHGNPYADRRAQIEDNASDFLQAPDLIDVARDLGIRGVRL